MSIWLLPTANRNNLCPARSLTYCVSSLDATFRTGRARHTLVAAPAGSSRPPGLATFSSVSRTPSRSRSASDASRKRWQREADKLSLPDDLPTIGRQQPSLRRWARLGLRLQLLFRWSRRDAASKWMPGDRGPTIDRGDGRLEGEDRRESGGVWERLAYIYTYQASLVECSLLFRSKCMLLPL